MSTTAPQRRDHDDVRARRRAASSRRRLATPIMAMVITALAVVAEVGAVTHLKRGDLPPHLTLEDLRGTTWSTQELRGRMVVVIFGELYHAKTLAACDDIRRLLEEDRFAEAEIVALLAVTEHASAEALANRAREAGVLLPVLHDPSRLSFAAFRVAVMPSVVVIDREGRVVRPVAGYDRRFRDKVADALLFGIGRLSAEQFDRSLTLDSETDADASAVRAARFASLARELARRGLDDLAEEKYREALEIDSERSTARTGLGLLLLRRGRLADAERQLRRAVEQQPSLTEAALGLAQLKVMRGGAELDEAERVIRDILARSPGEARAHYLLGIVHEQRDELQQAAARYRTAAELLMRRDPGGR